MSESVTIESTDPDGLSYISLCSVPGCAFPNAVVIFYDEAEILAGPLNEAGTEYLPSDRQRLPPHWHVTSGAASFGPSSLRCAKCNQPLNPVFTQAEIARDLAAAKGSGVLADYHVRRGKKRVKR